jgi:hypothetical protein
MIERVEDLGIVTFVEMKIDQGSLKMGMSQELLNREYINALF